MLAVGLGTAAQPLFELAAGSVRALARLAEDLPEAVRVVVVRGVDVAARILAAASHVVAAEDPVELALLDPAAQLGNSPHGERMRVVTSREEAHHLVPARLPLLVLGGLLQERVEVEPPRRQPRGE